MKKFTKLFLSSALVAAMALTSVVAFADGETQTEFNVSGTELKGATYSTETGLLTVPAEVLKGRDADSQATFLVYEKTDGAVTQEKIVGIDQSDSTFSKNGLKGKPQLPGENEDAKVYTVKVGYYKSGTFTVLSGDLKISNGADVLYGDCNDLAMTYTPDGKQNSADAVAILKFANHDEAAEAALVGDLFTAADVATFGSPSTEAGDGKLNTADSVAILRFANKQTTDIGILKQYVEEE